MDNKQAIIQNAIGLGEIVLQGANNAKGDIEVDLLESAIVDDSVIFDGVHFPPEQPNIVDLTASPALQGNIPKKEGEIVFLPHMPAQNSAVVEEPPLEIVPETQIEAPFQDIATNTVPKRPTTEMVVSQETIVPQAVREEIVGEYLLVADKPPLTHVVSVNSNTTASPAPNRNDFGIVYDDEEVFQRSLEQAIAESLRHFNEVERYEAALDGAFAAVDEAIYDLGDRAWNLNQEPTWIAKEVPTWTAKEMPTTAVKEVSATIVQEVSATIVKEVSAKIVKPETATNVKQEPATSIKGASLVPTTTARRVPAAIVKEVSAIIHNAETATNVKQEPATSVKGASATIVKPEEPASVDKPEPVKQADPATLVNQESPLTVQQDSSRTRAGGVFNVEQEQLDQDDSVVYDTKLVSRLCDIFPNACPQYVKRLCKNKKFENGAVDVLIDVILNTNDSYPKRVKCKSPEPVIGMTDQLSLLKEFLPDADPDYLQMMVEQFESKKNTSEQIMTFVNDAMEMRNYPTLKDYQRRQQLSAQQRQYTTEFKVENFLRIIPEPKKFFTDPKRNVPMSSMDSHYALVFLRNKFDQLPLRTIQSTYSKNGNKLMPTVNYLRSIPAANWMKSRRKRIEMPKTQNIPLLQEIAFITHEEQINLFLETKKLNEEKERQQAKTLGLLMTCNCCYDDEILARDIVSCPNGCVFCNSCTVKSVEILFGEGKLDFPCLMNCSYMFDLQTLQTVVPPKLFSKIVQKKAMAEVKAAGIPELEYCPFCDFASIPPEGNKVFSCLNPDCMKESCRACKEPSHLPLRCDEIEKDEEVKARVFVENKMTEALLKKCWKCGVSFFKEDGCNKMTCSCGAKMCYICNQPVTDYKHFNGQGGDRFDLCPLYSDNVQINKENVLKGAEAAKAEIDPTKLKSDPANDINEFYKQTKRMRIENGAVVPPGLRMPADFNNMAMNFQYLRQNFQQHQDAMQQHFQGMQYRFHRRP